MYHSYANLLSAHTQTHKQTNTHKHTIHVHRYMNDHHHVSSSVISVPGRSPAHPLLSAALSTNVDREDKEDKENVDIYEAIGQGVDVNFIMKVRVCVYI